MKNDKEVVFAFENTDTDIATGEVKTITTYKKKRLPKERPYVKTYLDDMLYLNGVSPSLRVVLDLFTKYMDYDNILNISAGMKKSISKQGGCSIHTVNKALWLFTKARIMFRQDTGVYLLNPYLFSKGDWKDILEIRSTITWNERGKEMTTVFSKSSAIDEGSDEEFEDFGGNEDE